MNKSDGKGHLGLSSTITLTMVAVFASSSLCLELCHSSVGIRATTVFSYRPDGILPEGSANAQVVDEDLMMQRLNDVRCRVVEVSQHVHETNKWTQDKELKSATSFEQGSVIMKKVIGPWGTLQDRWIGPCRITKILGPVAFDVLELHGHRLRLEYMQAN